MLSRYVDGTAVTGTELPPVPYDRQEVQDSNVTVTVGVAKTGCAGIGTRSPVLQHDHEVAETDNAIMIDIATSPSG